MSNVKLDHAKYDYLPDSARVLEAFGLGDPKEDWATPMQHALADYIEECVRLRQLVEDSTRTDAVDFQSQACANHCQYMLRSVAKKGERR